MKPVLIAIVAAAACTQAFAQREFLTNNEIEQIRDAQEPNLRLNTYILFARQRLDQLQQQIAKDKKGRSLIVRQLLEEYVQIIDAIDTVSDNALKRKLDIAEGTTAVAAAETKFLEQLKKVQESQPHDLDMYDIALKDAIGDTDDSIASARETWQALGNRRGEGREGKEGNRKRHRPRSDQRAEGGRR